METPCHRPQEPRTFEDVIAQIERRIVEDGLTVGDRLPAERQLAEQLGVGRSSVREAMRVLETLGVVSSQVGRGPDAGAVLTSRPATRRSPTCSGCTSGLASLELREVIDTRLMIERWAAAPGGGRPRRHFGPGRRAGRDGARRARPRSSWSTTRPSTAPSRTPRATG